MKFKTHLIMNLTQGTVIAQNAALADSFLERLKGLLGRKHLSKNSALIIKPCSMVHTMFMRFDIDVIFLDEENYVIKKVSDIKPNRLFIGTIGALQTVELPAGTIKKAKIHVGDKIEMGRVV